MIENWSDDSLERLLEATGFFGATGTFFAYVMGHQGNVRAVVTPAGDVAEVNHYYPYGMLMTPEAGVQPHKYGGKELDRQNGLDWYDSQARWYDPALGRTTTMDPMAEDYPGISPYAWCAGNPVRFTDPTGMVFTEKSWDHILKLQNEIGKKLDKNLHKIQKYSDEIASGKIDGKKASKLQGKIESLQKNNLDLLEVGMEIVEMAVSDQVYDVQLDYSNNVYNSTTGDYKSVSTATYNFTTDIFEMRLGDTNLYTLAHELKHGYQFEKGQFSTGKYQEGYPYYDYYDEVEAYERGKLFNGPSINPMDYPKIQRTPASFVDLAGGDYNYLQGVANRHKAAFRYNGITYKWDGK